MAKRNKKIYKARLVYFFKCDNCGTSNRQTYHKGTRRDGICRTCKRRQSKISPGQEPLFAGDGRDGEVTIGVDMAKGQDAAVAIIRHGQGKHIAISMPRQPGKNTIKKMIGKGRAS